MINPFQNLVVQESDDQQQSNQIVHNGLQLVGNMVRKSSQIKSIETGIKKINELCDQQGLAQQFRQELITTFQKMKKKPKPEQFFDDQLEMKIRQQVMRSIKNFIQIYIDGKDNFHIEVKDNQLNLNCRIDIQNTIGYSKFGIMQVNELSKAMYMNFDSNKFTSKSIPQKIEIMFGHLFDCFKFFLYRQFQDKNSPIDEMDFLMFPEKQLKERYKKKGIAYKSKYEPIRIGGLIGCCFRFFRVLFQFFLSYYDLFIIPDIQQRRKCIYKKDSNFKNKTIKYIQDQLSQIRNYESQDLLRKLDQQITKQMKGFCYEDLYNHFCDSASTSKQKIYDSQSSISLYRWLKISSKISNVEKIHSETIQSIPTQASICSCFYQARFVPKSNEQQNPKLNLRSFKGNKGFKKHFDIKISIEKFQTYGFIYAYNNKLKVQIEKSGKFAILGKTQDEVYKVKSFLGNTFKQFEIKEEKQILAAKTHIGIPIQNFNLLVFAPCFKGEIDVKTRKPQNHNKTAQIQQDIQQEEILAIIYNSQKTSWENHDLKRQKIMKMTIFKNGNVFMTEFDNFQVAVKKFQQIKKKLADFFNSNEEIKKIRQIKKQQRLESLAQLNILAYPTKWNSNINDRKTYGHDNLHFNNLTHRNTITTQGQIQKDPQVFERKSLKILTWNIMSYKLLEDIDRMKNQKMSQQQKKQTIEEMKEDDHKRFVQMVDVIRQLNPDIICLQEPFYLYNYKRELFQKLLVGKDNERYHYAEYKDGPKGDFPKKNDDGTYKRNERTMILSKFPVKFSYLFSRYKNYNSSDQETNFKQSIIADFKLAIEPHSKTYLNVLIASVHLKAHNYYGDNNIRKFQFEYLDNLCQDFDISILAGDFNSYDKPYDSNDLSPISNVIRQKGWYVDFQDCMVSKEATNFSYKKPPTVTDKILIRFKKDYKIEERLRVQDINFPGCFTVENHQGNTWKLRQKNGDIRTLSDHIGRYVQFGFKKQK